MSLMKNFYLSYNLQGENLSLNWDFAEHIQLPLLQFIFIPHSFLILQNQTFKLHHMLSYVVRYKDQSHLSQLLFLWNFGEINLKYNRKILYLS